MTNLLRRLRKLESRLTDRSGLAPGSETWLEYWGEKLDRFLSEGDPKPINGMPLAFIDAIIAEAIHAEQTR
jgi:hypothetical protein